MGGGDMENLEKGVCALLWVSAKETARECPSHEKKDNRAGPLQTASQIVGQHSFMSFGWVILIYTGWVSLPDNME